ncbi:hypothetical protein H072_9224 [Dactylellina haptotyla CBS 200.50]|uniref:Uncharacterized protein n=1 Tax=Dactylellina haptotyla (strain CBS 200.50) TaxID=1284197 RepID=S8A7M2_DACHA|nr:hypothetical protein H072_9224 [Dactylellina haptotyla CBS 200.50]
MASPLPPPSRLPLIHAYRRLLRAGLRAVQSSLPARLALRSKLRHAFRADSPSRFDTANSPASRLPSVFPHRFSQTRIDNTIRFLNTAAARLGLEHTIVKNLCMVELRRATTKLPRSTTIMRAAEWKSLNILFDEYDDTIRMLNETMQLELR